MVLIIHNKEYSVLKEIGEGNSDDRKYQVIDSEGTLYFLRIAPYYAVKKKQSECYFRNRIQTADIITERLIDLEVADDGIYLLFLWINGRNLDAALYDYSPAEQYSAGLVSGYILRKLHSIQIKPADYSFKPIRMDLTNEILETVHFYSDCGEHFDGDAQIISFLSDNYAVTSERESLLHGDFHAGNIITADGVQTLIDFELSGIGDPWSDLKGIIWTLRDTPLYAFGMISAYFDNCPPIQFFDALTTYVYCFLLHFVNASLEDGNHETKKRLAFAGQIFSLFQNEKGQPPEWYGKCSIE